MANRTSEFVALDDKAYVDDLRKTLRLMRRLPKEAQAELRAEVQRMTEGHAAVVRRAMGAWQDRRIQLLASQVRAKKDRIPVVLIGKATRLAVSGRPKGTEALYGAEFGAYQDGPNGWRFPPRTPKLGRGNEGYTIYPALRGRQAELVRDWERAVLRSVRSWSD
ncbi:MAG: hypothetical protein ACLFUG_11415 [Nitriliruptoraceae bacterium]